MRRSNGIEGDTMKRDQYFVVFHKGEWQVRNNGEYIGSYDSQKQAIDAASQAAKDVYDMGMNSQVLVQGKNNAFRSEYTFGDDPEKHTG